MLLILKLPEQDDVADQGIRRALAAVDCIRLSQATYELPSTTGHDEALRELARQCATAGGFVWLFAEPTHSARDDGTYNRLQDRTEHYARSLEAWRLGREPLPVLLPGELICL